MRDEGPAYYKRYDNRNIGKSEGGIEVWNGIKIENGRSR